MAESFSKKLKTKNLFFFPIYLWTQSNIEPFDAPLTENKIDIRKQYGKNYILQVIDIRILLRENPTFSEKHHFDQICEVGKDQKI